jgi:hypothetical protein
MKRIIALIFFFYACESSPFVNHPATIIYSSEDACQELVHNSRRKIDSFVMLRCKTADTTVWRYYEGLIQKEIAFIFHELDTTNGKFYKYVNTHYEGKKIPCAIGDSVLLFYKTSVSD